jgi:hypothetical protein
MVPGLLSSWAEVRMSVVSRIQIVGAITTSIATALGVFAMFWLVSQLDVLPGVPSLWLGAALLMGLPLLATLCLVQALSIDASQRGVQWQHELEPTLGDPGAFEHPPLEVGRV